MRATLVLCLALAAAGCDTDVCKGVMGTCLSARVEGPGIGQLDQLQIDMSVAGTTTSRKSPMLSNMPFNLPVKLAIQIAQPTSTAQITITGIRNGMVVTQPLSHDIPIVNGRGSQTFVLAALVGDMKIDLATPPPPPDFSGVPVVITPGSYDFLQPVVTGQQTSERGVFVVTNNTTESVFIGPDPGDMSVSTQDKSFQPDPSFGTPQGPCPVDPGGMGFQVPMKSTCTIAFQFIPTDAGSHTFTATVHPKGVSTGTIFPPPYTISLSGSAGFGWSSDPSPGGLNAVWGSGPNDLYAVGSGIFYSMGDGSWNTVITPSIDSTRLFAVTGSGGGSVWFGGSDTTNNNELIILGTGGPGVVNSFVTETFSPTDVVPIRALIFDTAANSPLALSDKGFLTRSTTSVWTLDPTSVLGNPGYALTPASFVNGIQAWTRKAGAWTGMLTPSVDASFVPNDTLRGIWGNGNDVWIVGMGGLIWHYAGGPQARPVTEDCGVTMDLLAVTARDTAMGPEVWAVGSLGQTICHRTPSDGMWHKELLPTNGQLRGVWVDPPTGVVVAVGDSIARFH